MKWFRRWWKAGAEPAGRKRKPRPRPHPAPVQRPRRERYSGWNDPDLPLYGDPFDG